MYCIAPDTDLAFSRPFALTESRSQLKAVKNTRVAFIEVDWLKIKGPSSAARILDATLLLLLLLLLRKLARRHWGWGTGRSEGTS